MNFITKNKYVQTHKIELIIFGIALLLRIILFSINLHYQQGILLDTIHGDDGYYEISQGLIHGHGFTGSVIEPFMPNPLRPPVWPFIIAFLAKIFGTYWAVAVFEILIGSLIPVLGLYVARAIIPERYARTVGFLLAFEPYSILLSFILYTETCFTFLFLIFLIFLFKYIKEQTIRNAVWSGVFLGLATLVKPTVQYFPIIIPLVILYALRKRLTKDLWKHLIIFLTVFCLLIAPWIYRNYKEFGQIGMSAQPAFNLYVYLVPTVLSINNHTKFIDEVSNFVTKDGFDVNGINLSNSKLYTDKAVNVLKDHKTALVKSVGITLLAFFTHDGMLTVLLHSGVAFDNVSRPSLSIPALTKVLTSPALFVVLARLAWIMITLLFLYGLFSHVRKEGLKTETILILVIVLYFALTTAINGLGVNARFRIPINVFIFSFAIYGFYAIKGRISNYRSTHETIHSHSVL